MVGESDAPRRGAGRAAPRRALVLALLALAAGAPGAAQEPVRAIELRGLRALAEETLRFYLGLEEGAPLDRAALDRRVKELWERKLVDDVRVEALAEGDGVRLVVTVVERPVLRSIDYEGLKGISRTDVNERIAKEQIDVREGDPLDLGELKRLESTLEAMYAEKGFRFADATFRLEEVSPTERRVVFAIDEAEKVRIGDIRFSGNRVYGDFRLKLAMKKTKETGLVSRLMRKDIYNPAAIEEDLQKVRDLYRGAGYKTAAVLEPKLSVIEKGARRRLGIEIPVEEGARFKLGEIRLEGASVFREEVLRSRFKRPRGGWLRKKTIDEGLDAVRDMYRNFGHIMVEVEGELVERAGNVADLVVEIREGDQFRVGKLEFEGNTRTRDKVLRREFRVHEGTLLNMGAVKNSLFKINQLEYFKVDEDDPISFENFDAEKKTVDLQVRGEESDRTELQIGGGWSEAYDFFGQVSVRTRNFLGRGETVGVSAQAGKYSNQYDVSYFVPWFLDRPQSIGVQFYDNEVDYTSIYDVQNTQKARGGVLTWGRNLGLFQSFSIAYNRFERDDTLEVFGADGNLVPLRYEISNSSIRPAWVFESRDSRLEPTTGGRLALSVEYAGGLLGGNNYFVRPELGVTWFRTLTWVPVKTVVGVNLEAGWIEPTQGYELNPLERYYLGGENSIRGFEFRDLTVRCLGGEPFPGRPLVPCRKDERLIDQNGALLGGDKFLQANLEYHVLLGGPFRLIAFADAAQVYGADQPLDPGRLRLTAGGELRIFVPVFGAPLRFIYASNLEPLPDDRFETFQFSIGTTF
jgi:outer membrane protein insertion porin family